MASYIVVCRRKILFFLLGLFIVTAGCSLVMETKRPEATDVSTVQKGTPRYQVTAVFGKPLQSYQVGGKDIDIFQADPNGRHVGTKIAVNTFNTAADVLTIGLWEVVATPAEMLTKHKLTTYVVTYDANQKVESIEAVAGPPTKPAESLAASSPSPSPTGEEPSDAATATPAASPSPSSTDTGSTAASATPSATPSPAA